MTLPPAYCPQDNQKKHTPTIGQVGGRVIFFILLILLSVNFVSAESVKLSTSAYENGKKASFKGSSSTRPPAYSSKDNLKTQKFRSAEQAGGRVILNLEKTRHNSIASLDYSVKWDFKDFASFNIFSKKFYSSLNPIGNWDITDNTRFKMYGFSMNPWRILIKKEKVPAAGSGIFKDQANRKSSKIQYKKKVRFSLYPIYNELTRDMESQIRDILLKESFKGRLPGWESADKKTKRLFINDLLFMDDIWEIPVINGAKGSLEYLSEEEKKKE